MLLLGVFISVYGRDNVYLAANVTSKDLDEEIDHYSRIVEILEDRRERIQNGEELDTFVMVIDEAAQIFTGSGSDQHKAKQLAKILKLARKSDANLILIGHDGKDIGPSLRALCTLFVHKESQTTATFYRDVRNRQGIGEMMSLSGITPPIFSTARGTKENSSSTQMPTVTLVQSQMTTSKKWKKNTRKR